MKLTGKTVTVTLKNGSDIQGSVFRVDTSMTIHLKSAKITRKDSDPMTLDFTTIRG
jgi:small nuclear ribonucleoprotein (snRNP)-like protein